MSLRIKRFITTLVALCLVLSAVWTPVRASDRDRDVDTPTKMEKPQDVPTIKLDGEPMYATFLRILALVRTYYVQDIPLERLLRGAINGALEILDPYTIYFGNQEYSNFIDSTVTGSFGGVGIHIDVKDGYITIIAPIPGTPAAIADLKAGDRILEVDGVSAKGWTVDMASLAIRGQPGTSVKLKIQKAGSGQVIDLEIVRAVVKLPTVDVLMAEDGQVGIIRLHRFNVSTADDMGLALLSMKERGVKGVILDLRNNPGGLLSSSLEVLAYLIPRGPALHIIDRSGQQSTYNSGTSESILPMIVLINGGTASASEVVAGAIKDYGTGVIAGTKSFGKGSIQTLQPLPNGEALKITTHRYITPKKNQIDGKGITPDIELREEAWPEPLKAPPVVRQRQFKMSDSGVDISQLERAMIALGHLRAKDAKGTYTETLFTAVGKYQLAKGLIPTGYPNEDLVDLINADLVLKGVGGLDRQTWDALQLLKQKVRLGF